MPELAAASFRELLQAIKDEHRYALSAFDRGSLPDYQLHQLAVSGAQIVLLEKLVEAIEGKDTP